jgi:hypothetical protein
MVDCQTDLSLAMKTGKLAQGQRLPIPLASGGMGANPEVGLHRDGEISSILGLAGEPRSEETLD